MSEIYRQRDVWKSKPILKKVYADIYARMARYALPGTNLEIGSGGVNLISNHQNTIHTDIQNVSWVDVVSDAHKMPFDKNTFDNIFMLDVLHHLHSPVLFFEESRYILKKGGRIIMVEPAITLFSGFFYKNFHSEPVNLNVDVFKNKLSTDDPYDSNQAIPTLLFKDVKNFEKNIKDFRIITKKEFSLLTYPLSGGFRNWSLLPVFLYPSVFKLESYLEKILSQIMGFRLLVVLEKIN